MFKNFWIVNKKYDWMFFILPSFLSVFIALIIKEVFHLNEVNLWVWLIFILLLDVSHVYSTLFRTYFHKEEYKEHRLLLKLLPMGLWVLGVFLYHLGALVFWRVIAYVAVFHFIRQQFGFLRLYSQKEQLPNWSRVMDEVAVYNACLYPVIYWHLYLPREFNWFIAGDFISFDFFKKDFVVGSEKILLFIYVFIFLLYIIKEMKLFRSYKVININKNLILVGSAFSWYLGIVYFNSDLVFTITNVFSHGGPYIALIWAYGKKESAKNPDLLVMEKIKYASFFKGFGFIFFLSVLFFLAFVEEGLWAGFIWREHLSLFPGFSLLEKITQKEVLTLLVPLLILPQITHYVLDGFIWKVRNGNQYWQKVFRS